MDKTIIKTLFNIIVALTLLSYFIASFAKPKVIPQMAPSETDKNFCVTCRNVKPPRTHHCSVCGICVPKMDHHCPWLGTCVGYHNFKQFFLFCFYQALVGAVYGPQVVKYAFFSPDETLTMSTGGQVCYYITNVLALPIAVALFPLSARIMVQLYNNLTTIEMMHDKQTRYPFYGIKRKDGNKTLTPNEYDMFWLANAK